MLLKSLVAIILCQTIVTLHAEEAASKPIPIPGPHSEHSSKSSEEIPGRTTLIVAELKDIRFDARGHIRFTDSRSGITYLWAANLNADHTTDTLTAIAMLGELRRAAKVEFFTDKSEVKIKEISQLTLIYESLK